MDEPYKNREIDEKFSHIQDTLARIETQTTKTNGTVRWLIKMAYMSLGAIGVITIVILPLMWALINANQLKIL
jgi:hypothetical protein